MDQDAYRKTYTEINERFCVFEKGILSGNCNCRLAKRFCLAEREGVHCGSGPGQETCSTLLGLLQEHSRFALRLDPHETALPHAKALRLQIGGLKGVAQATASRTGETPDEPLGDINGLLSQAIALFGELGNLPMQEVIHQIALFKGRVRRSGD
jgi:hypothetical protein